jgi:hypothetical protein
MTESTTDSIIEPIDILKNSFLNLLKIYILNIDRGQFDKNIEISKKLFI